MRSSYLRKVGDEEKGIETLLNNTLENNRGDAKIIENCKLF